MPTPGGPYSGIWKIKDISKYIQDNAWPTVFFPSVSRVVMAGGRNGGSLNVIDYIDLTAQSNATDFGDLTVARQGAGATGSSTRALFGGGGTPTRTNIIDYVEFGTLGNATDFGDLSETGREIAACSNGTRGVYGGGSNEPSSPFNTYTNTIQYLTVATTGNTSDFGDLTTYRGPTNGQMCSSTRGVFGFGGTNPPGPGNVDGDVIDYITIATTGNATDFGDPTVAKQQGACLSSSTRGVMGGGGPSPARRTNVMEYITIASTGNATDFGDLTIDAGLNGGSASDTKGVFFGGLVPAAYGNQIDQITIATTGNATDFGDLTIGRDSVTGTCSNMGSFA
jgi:hypothetical protein